MYLNLFKIIESLIEILFCFLNIYILAKIYSNEGTTVFFTIDFLRIWPKIVPS